ncbi:hypothetical protein A2331_05925 [Candidatus Falkowbacteria bacterium RIFOXYB2_FULL_34_18]|uniref:Uncharacterized protein n=1 Tax=Candidatus Falkowbacteria bacterium RIFOXYD2_FULL_34_120 TaxID=1798007 RepID=A0A1F5TPL8_9BACT|nr:MAG: hypothetical protein A2331_05925 [Candidatus Falkowbacteria bacterium RIFOXYB2_FULL_34_18]OGF29074.1 MAG: hypothetical protein A2500_03470 [Candidatus Falkowbacteria bacterium RIFOXYC12_FULL_34_55]OGF36116.1 MAG: hypothetical protein A2466_03500 [Candidatus Falkowbacteria bacterium RIFOXYC2_FULL_34_220]OGF38568.1 MAG: hypothetical protein A2515_04760 [Candidatus Falkowbacteria bacterium RIFOXYD12_FULL_34_57]OGF40759.1 MAG: hypothetical protein A2531_06995 [Candidatus Falkowbacteria bact
MKKRTLFKSVLSTLLSLIIFCAFISVAQAQDFDPSRSGSGVIFTGDHDKFSLGSPLKSKDGAIVGVSSDVILTFNNGKEKKELNLKNIDQYEDFKKFCQKYGYKVIFEFPDVETGNKILIIKATRL